MNKLERAFPLKDEARLRYRDGDYDVITPGKFVRCAVTGQIIALDELRYWSVPLQEAYATPQISMQRYLDMRESGQ